jgi:hypothetical protein
VTVSVIGGENLDERAVSSTNLTDYFEEITGCLGNVYYEP